MPDKNVNIQYTADADQAISETERLKASMAGLTDKTVRLRVITEEEKLSRWTSGMGMAGDAADRASAANDRFGRSARGMGDDLGRSSSAVRDAGRAFGDFDRAAGSSGGLRSVQRDAIGAGRSMLQLESGTDRAHRSLGEIGSGGGDSDGGIRAIGSGAHGAAIELRDFGDGVYRASERSDRSSSGFRAPINAVTRLREGFDGVEDAAGGATRGLGGVASGAGSASGTLGAAGSAASMFGQAMAFSAAGSGLLTAGVGALGVAGVASFGGVGAAAGLAGGAMANFAVDAHQDSARFGKTLEQMGKQAHLTSQYVSEPLTESIVGLGRSMVTAEGQMTPAGMRVAGGLRDSFSIASAVVDKNADSIVEAGANATAGMARITAEAAPGVSAFLGELPSLTKGAVDGISQITSEFGRSSGAIEASTPAWNRMMGAAGGLGGELVSIGAANGAGFAEDMTSMLGGVTQMASDLRPAIQPAMTAFTDLVNAGTGGVGSLGDEVTGFSQTVSQSAPQIQSLVSSVGEGMLSLGGAAVAGVARSAPAFESMAANLAKNSPGISDTVETLSTGVADAVSLGGDAATAFDKIDDAFQAPRKAMGGRGLLGATWDALSGDPNGPDKSGTGSGIGPNGGGELGPGSKINNWVREQLGLPQTTAGGAAGGGFGDSQGGGGGGGGGASSMGAAPDWVPAGPGGIAGQFSGIGMSYQMDDEGNLSPSVATRSGGRAVDKPVSKEQMGLVKELQDRIDSPAATPMQKKWAEMKQADVARGITGPENMRKQLDTIGPLPPPPTAAAAAGQASQRAGGSPADQFSAMTKTQGQQPFNIADSINAKQGNAASNALGQSVPQGAAAGINQGAGAPAAAAKNMASKATKAAAKEWETRSPSRVFRRWGRSAPDGGVLGINDGAPALTQATVGMAKGAVDGFGSALGGMAAASDRALGKTAAQMSDRALPIGYVWGENLVTGAASVIKKADFKAAGTPNIDNADSRAWLAAMGFLGPGAGAAISKAPVVSFGGSDVAQIAAAVARVVASRPIQVDVDGAPFRRYVDTSMDNGWSQFDEALVGARG